MVAWANSGDPKALPDKDRDWMFSQYKGRIDELVEENRTGELKQSSFQGSVRKTCGRILFLLCRTLIPALRLKDDSKSKQNLAGLLRLKGDYLRYLCKFTTGGVFESQESLGVGEKNGEQAKKSYEEAVRICSHVYTPL